MIMNGLFMLNIILTTSYYITDVAGIVKIPLYNKVYELCKKMQLPLNDKKNEKGILEFPKPDNEDWESGEVLWDLDQNVTNSNKTINKKYEQSDAHRLGMLMI